MTAPEPVTLGAATDAWLATLIPKTASNYKAALEPLAEHYGRDTPLAELDPADAGEWFTARWGHLSPATWNMRLAALRSAVRYWHDRGWDAPDITARLRSRKKREVLPAEPLSPEEVAALLAQTSSDYFTPVRNRALITLMARSGLRISEALALRVSDVNFRDHTLRLLETKSGEAQTAPFSFSADDALKRWIDKRKAAGIRANGHPLFCTHGGDPLSADYVRHMLRRLAGKAGVDKRVHPHGLRHTYATELMRAGVQVDAIQALLRHERLATTAVYIGRLGNGQAAKALQAADLPDPARPAPAETDPERIARLEQQLAELRQLIAGDGD